MMVYTCQLCPETFTKAAQLGGHVHANHPEHKRPLPSFLRTEPPPRKPRRSLKRDTDTWAGRP